MIYLPLLLFASHFECCNTHICFVQRSSKRKILGFNQLNQWISRRRCTLYISGEVELKPCLKGCWWIQVNQQKFNLQGPGFLIVTLTFCNQIGESRIRFFLIFLVELQFFFAQQGGGKNSGSPTCDQLVPFSAGFIKLPKFEYPSRTGHSNGLSHGGYSLHQNKWPKIHRELGFHPWNKWSYGPTTYDWFGGPPCRRNAYQGRVKQAM